jgi:cytochrome d ubiquinol oxidase subunit II
LVAFPGAYAILLPSLYLPVIIMLLGLIFRGVAFEFRHLSHSKKPWNLAFAGGSAVAAISQGMILGGMIQGIEVQNGQFSGGLFDWATPFSLMCGIGLTTGYGLLGATWLIMKSQGAVADRARRQAKALLALVMLFMAAVSLWTPLGIPRIAERWFAFPNLYYLWPVPTVTASVAFMAWRWIENGRDVTPFLASIGLFLLGYLGLVISSFPYLVPPSLTIWDTAAARSPVLPNCSCWLERCF